MMETREAYESGTVGVENSGWLSPQGPAKSYPRLETTLSTDILVVGAGLCGSSLALHVAEAGVKVVVLEARQPAWGASGRNVGQVVPLLYDYDYLSRFPDGGRTFLKTFLEQSTVPFDVARKYGIDCDATRSGYLTAMTSRKAFDTYRAKAVKVGHNATPLGGAEMQTATGTDHYGYGVMFHNGGRINPYLFTNGMIAAAERLGAVIHGDSEATSVEPQGGRWRVRTAHGEVVADRVVFCTSAYATGVVPEFAKSYYPMVPFAMTTKPLSPEALDYIMPSGASLGQVPIELNPMTRDRYGRIIFGQLPMVGRAHDPQAHFKYHLDWMHKVWPKSRQMNIEPGQFWTGRVAMRGVQFPGVFELHKGFYGLMFFNAVGNVMAPLMGKLMAEALAQDRMDKLSFPIEVPRPVSFPRKYSLLVRNLFVPAARIAQKMRLI